VSVRIEDYYRTAFTPAKDVKPAAANVDRSADLPKPPVILPLPDLVVHKARGSQSEKARHHKDPYALAIV